MLAGIAGNYAALPVVTAQGLALHTVVVMVIDGKHDIRTQSPIFPCNNRVYRVAPCQASIPSIIIGNGKFQSAAAVHPSLSAQGRGSHCKPVLC